jgi:hypothetical protein
MGCHRFTVCAVAALAILAAAPARSADLAAPAPSPVPAILPGWSFTVTPYFWLAGLSAKVNLATPGGGTISQGLSIDPFTVLSELRFGFMSAAEADYDRFAILTDVIYSNTGAGGSVAKFGQIRNPAGDISFPTSTQLNLGVGTGMLVWTAEGGYEVAKGPWGEIKGLAGLRLLNLTNDTWYGLTANVTEPDGGIALAKNGVLSLSQTYVDGIVGVKGDLNISNTGLFIPYYLDAGTGGNEFTWQGFTGLGYRTKYADISIGYRYLSFENSSSKAVEYLNLGGVIASASFHF